MSQEILQITKGRDVTLYGTVTDMESLDGFTVTFTMKKKLSDSTATITKGCTVEGLNITIPLTFTETDVPAGVYLFDVVAQSSEYKYELASESIEVVQGVSS